MAAERHCVINQQTRDVYAIKKDGKYDHGYILK